MNVTKPRRIVSVQPQRIPRRLFLRGVLGGAAVAVGTPLFDSMLNSNGTALADGGELPRRFGVFYWGGGIVHSTWVPATTGAGYALPEALSDFADSKEYVTLVTGTNHKDSSPGHIPARGIALSSSHDMDTSIEGVGAYRGQSHPEPSVDALVLEQWSGQAAFDHVAIGICKKGPYQGNSSWERGGTAYNHHELSPQKVYDRLFGMGLPAKDTHLFDVTMALEQSLLDAVMEDGKALQGKLGAVDRQRLEQHLDGIRAIEKRLQTIANGGASVCNEPSQPVEQDFGDGSSQEQKEDKSRIMSDLLTVALACDLSRVFSYEWSATQSGAIYWEVGVSTEHHQLSHDDYQGEGMQAITRFIMKNLAYLTDKLRSTAEGAGNLLDRTLIVGTSEHADAGNHNYSDHPYILVGKAAGGIKSGIHWRDTQNGNLNAPRVLLTAVRAVGVDVDGLGQQDSDGNRRVTESLPDLVP